MHFLMVFSLRDVLNLVQEVYPHVSELKSKLAYYKKTQATLKSMLQSIFGTQGINIKIIICF